MKLLLAYLFLINALSFALMHIDKKKAIRGSWRIPERTLLLTCLLGGSYGGLLGMKLFRHKTLHLKFSIGLPCMAAVHTVLLIICFSKI